MLRFNEIHDAAYQYFKRGPWYIDVKVDDVSVVDPIFYALEAYWPGLQVLAGKSIKDASDTQMAFHTVWQRYRFVPEMYDVSTNAPHPMDSRYILRPVSIRAFAHSRIRIWLIK